MLVCFVPNIIWLPLKIMLFMAQITNHTAFMLYVYVVQHDVSLFKTTLHAWKQGFIFCLFLKAALSSDMILCSLHNLNCYVFL